MRFLIAAFILGGLFAWHEYNRGNLVINGVNGLGGKTYRQTFLDNAKGIPGAGTGWSINDIHRSDIQTIRDDMGE